MKKGQRKVPVDLKKVKKTRQTYKDLFAMIDDLNSFDGQGKLAGFEMLIMGFFSKMQETTLVRNLPQSNSGLNAAGKKVMTMMGDLTVQEAVTMLKNATNAIDTHRNRLVIDKNVKDLNIELLDPNEIK